MVQARPLDDGYREGSHLDADLFGSLWTAAHVSSVSLVHIGMCNRAQRPSCIALQRGCQRPQGPGRAPTLLGIAAVGGYPAGSFGTSSSKRLLSRHCTRARVRLHAGAESEEPSGKPAYSAQRRQSSCRARCPRGGLRRRRNSCGEHSCVACVPVPALLMWVSV